MTFLFLTLGSIRLWLIIGIVLIVLEFMHFTGIGFFFLGLGAISTSIFIYFFPDVLNFQVVIFGFSSLIWFLIFRRPLKLLTEQDNKSSRHSFEMIGAEVRVANIANPVGFDPRYDSPLQEKYVSGGRLIQVNWSGTIMNAKLTEPASINVGDILHIVNIEGNILICAPMSSKE